MQGGVTVAVLNMELLRGLVMIVAILRNHLGGSGDHGLGLPGNWLLRLERSPKGMLGSYRNRSEVLSRRGLPREHSGYSLELISNVIHHNG
jgi:hypothetical protein